MDDRHAGYITRSRCAGYPKVIERHVIVSAI